MNLSELMPERPYHSEDDFLRKEEAYYKERDEKAKGFLDKYDAMLIVGGSGPIVDLVNNQRLHDLILAFYDADKLIGAECYGVTCLAFARSEEDRKSIIWGRHVTGHPIEYDYHDGTGFVGTDLNMGPPPYPLEYILRDAVGPEGQFHGNVGHETSVIVDYPFITGRSTADSVLTGKMLVEVLEEGRLYYGWRGPDRVGTPQVPKATKANGRKLPVTAGS
jgi:putative intracellular protease/amidase